MHKKSVYSWCVTYREGKSVYDVEGERKLVDLAGGLRVKGGSVSGAEHLCERAPRSPEAGFFVCVPRDWRGLKG